MVKTKIIATIGPASTSKTILRKMFINGLDIARLNFSHGSHEEHLERVKLIRQLNKRLRRHIRIMQDLEGYRIRVGKLKAPITLKKNKIMYLIQGDASGDEREIPFDYTGSLKRIKQGALVFIDDGKIVLQVLAKYKSKLKVKVRNPGTLKPHKGINIPDTDLDFEALTNKDKEDVQVAINEKLDFVAQSFVRSVKDLNLLEKILKPEHPNCKIFAKIENRQALRNIDKIIKKADGIVVARGDLGICIPIYKVPVVQKNIIRKCLKSKKPVVVATQMLDSMTEEDLPTRAEVSDVANAILDGSTHLLLSQETAVGKHPDLVIEMMNRVIKYTEAHKNLAESLKDI